MAKEQHLDIIRKVLTNIDGADLYIDGDENNDYILLIESNDVKDQLNELFKEELHKNDIDTYPDYNWDDYYVNFATGDNYGFYDEYYICSECNKAFKTNNGYATAKVWLGDGFCLCANCVKEDPTEYINERLNNPDKMNVILSDSELEQLGFKKLNDEHYENGYYGIHDNPSKLYAKAKQDYPNSSILFSIYENYNPYATEFDIWIKES